MPPRNIVPAVGRAAAILRGWPPRPRSYLAPSFSVQRRLPMDPARSIMAMALMGMEPFIKYQKRVKRHIAIQLRLNQFADQSPAVAGND